MKTRSHLLKRALALLLALTSLLSLMTVGALASSIEDGSQTASMTLGKGQFYLKTTAGTSLGAWSYTYTTNDGLTGPAYCVDHGLHFTSKALHIDGKYTSSPQTAGVYANGYPQHSLDTFLGLYLNDNPILSGLTEGEYAYATQLAVWASLGQLGIDGTQFTEGRERIAQPTGDTQQMRIFRAIQLLLAVGATWTKIPQTGMYIRLEQDGLGGNISIPADMTLEFAADNESFGFKREVIGGKSYYTHEYIFASATSTYYDNYCMELWTDGAPAGTMFTDLNNTELQRGTYHENATWRLPTEAKVTTLNDNGVELVGTAKLCIPVDTAPNSGEITIRCGSFVMQYNIFLAKNETTTEQSYIIADPSKTALSTHATLKWGGSVTENGKLEVLKVDGSGNPLAGAVFTLSGSDGSSLTGTTDANGIIRWDMLSPLYTYTLTETTPPAGYGIAAAVNVSIQAARTNYVTVKDSTTKQITIHKQDAQNGYSLVGATIAFEQIDGSFNTTAKTDHAGNIQFDADSLPIGTYKVYETAAPEGYETDSTPQTVNWDGLHDITLTFRNVRKPTLTIYKCDEGNLRSLPYATFEVYKNGQLVTTVETNENGLAYVPSVTTGYYTVRETVAPEGYVLDSTEHSVYVDLYDPATTDDPRIVITNTAKPHLRILKYDAQTNEALSDTTFEVYRDATLLGQYTTDANGEIYLYDLVPGTYLVKEIAAKAGYTVNSTPQQIEVKAGTENYALTFLNQLKPGIHLTKLDSQTMQPLAGAKFRISEIGGTFSREYTTDASGDINLAALSPASYTVEEIVAPDGYLIDDASRTIKIVGGENAAFVFTDTRKPSFSLVKLDSLTGNRLPGATFRIAKIEDGTRYLDRVTDANGEINLSDMEPGVYSVSELSAPEGYIPTPTEYHVELVPGQTAKLVLSNDQKPDLKVIKRDADTGAALSDAVFTIKKADSSTLTTKTTDANGEIFIENLEPAVYEITEKTPPTGYLPAEQPTQLVTLVANKTAEAVFENHAKPALTVKKLDSVTGEPVKGAKFRIAYASNQTFTGEINELGDFFTDENGQIVIDKLKDGWYRVTELEPAAGYAIKEPATQEFFIKAGESKTVTFENVPLSALVVYKYDSVTGEAVKDAVFQVKYLSGTGGTVIGTYKTGANGSFTVTNLKAGTYTVEELASDSGHVIDAAPQTAFISGDPQAVVQLYFGNTPKGSVLIVKKDSITGEPISDVEFTITDSAGTLLGDANGKFTTDSAGSILIDGIDPGATLVVKETRAKTGYVLDDTPQTIQVRAGKTVTLEFRNQPKGSLIIEKYDAVTKERLAGATFRITGANGELIADNEGLTSTNGLYSTNAEGQIVLSKVTPATLVVTEVTAPDNYRLDPTPQTVVVGAGDTQTLRFYDDPLCTLTILKRDANTKKSLAKAEFTVKYSDGAYVGSDNGRYVTGTDGTVTVSGLKPDATVIVTETKAPLGYLISESAKSVIVRSGVANSLTFDDEPATTLVIRKYIEGTDYEPLAGVCFKVTDGSGAAVGPDDGVYYTDAAGEIVLTGLEPGITVKTREIKTAEGYVLDGTPQDIQIKSGEVQQLTFWNKKAGTLVIRKLSAADRKTPLAGAEFQLTYADGGYVDNANGKLSSNGKYTTDSNGEIRITGVTGTIVATETKAPDGYTIGTDKTQTVVVRTGETQTLTFYNDPYQTVVIQKYIDGTTKPLAGVTFLLTDGNGNKIGNGEYKTDANGRITLSVPVGTTIIARETKTVSGYVLNTTPQAITVKGGSSAQTVTTTSAATVVSDGSAANQLTFYDSTIGKLELVKVDAANKNMRLADATFEIRKMNQGVVTTVTTGRNGRAVVELDAGSYYAVETEAPDGYQLNATPTYFTIKDGKTTTVTVTNKAYSGITIRKTDAVTGEGIYGVSFLLYDARNNVVGQYTSDDRGYVYIENIEAGRYRIRELENEGYILDTQLKTVEVKSGEVTMVEWENTPITGQIQITKTSADYNSVNGWAAGTPIPNTVFEVYNRAGRLVDTIRTDKNGVAATKPLPLGRYKIVESKAAEFYALDKTPIEVEIEHAGQIVRAAMTNRSLYTNVSITKRGYVEVMPGQMIRYDFSSIANNSTTALESFYFRDTIPVSAVRLDTIVTGTWNVRGSYKIVYQTNLSNGYRTLADNLSTTRSYVLNASPAALGLAANEYVTEVMYSFGVVPSNFRQVEAPQIYCMVLNTLAGGTQFTNTADVGGVYDGQWITAADRWVTRVYAPVKPLPRTGY